MTTIAFEIQRFNRLGAAWWNPERPMRPLHVVNAPSLQYGRVRIAEHRRFSRRWFAVLRMP